MKFLKRLFGICNHDYTYHKIRYVQYDSSGVNKPMDYCVEFYQCEKCNHIHFITMYDNLKHSTCN